MYLGCAIAMCDCKVLMHQVVTLKFKIALIASAQVDYIPVTDKACDDEHDYLAITVSLMHSEMQAHSVC